MIVVADSSPLRYLIVFGLENLLPELFGETWIPSMVRRELTIPASPTPVRDFLHDPPIWLRIRDPQPESLLAVDADLDAGERAALLLLKAARDLALARELDATLVLVDDQAARNEAKALRIRVTGTLGLLRLAAERGLIDVPSVVVQLRQSGFYVTESLLLKTFGQWLG